MATTDILVQGRDGDVLIRWITTREQEIDNYVREKIGNQPSWREKIVFRVMIQVLAKFQGFLGTTGAELRSWVKAIARDFIGREIRRCEGKPQEVQLPESNSSGCHLMAGGPSPSGEAAEKEEIARLNVEIEHLPEHLKIVVQLKYWEVLTFAEIGDRLGIDEDTARYRYNKAIKLLRERMQ